VLHGEGQEADVGDVDGLDDGGVGDCWTFEGRRFEPQMAHPILPDEHTDMAQTSVTGLVH
jgi:hypothetical protein